MSTTKTNSAKVVFLDLIITIREQLKVKRAQQFLAVEHLIPT